MGINKYITYYLFAYEIQYTRLLKVNHHYGVSRAIDRLHGKRIRAFLPPAAATAAV